MLGALILSVVIATSSSSVTSVSASASGGSSAEASTHTVTNGNSSSVEVYTNVDGTERTERREFTSGGTVHVEVSASTSTTTGTYATSTVERQKITTRVLALVRSILAFFGLSVSDL